MSMSGWNSTSALRAQFIRGLVVEGLLGAALTGLMVLIFLRDWRSALIVVLNIPFALLSAVILLWATGQSINIMTLAGWHWLSAFWWTSHGGDREHPHADVAGRLARPRRGGGVPRTAMARSPRACTEREVPIRRTRRRFLFQDERGHTAERTFVSAAATGKRSGWMSRRARRTATTSRLWAICKRARCGAPRHRRNPRRRGFGGK